MIWQLRRRLRESRFDVALDCPRPDEVGRGGVALRLQAAHRLRRPLGTRIYPWLNNEFVDATEKHAVLRCLALLEPLGIYEPAVRFQVPRAARGCGPCRGRAAAIGLGESFAVIVVGAGWPSKLWPAERFAAVAAFLGRDWSLPSLVVWGNAEERHGRAEQVATGSQGHARVAPKMTLSQLGALAGRAKLFVGSDTGPLHLAAAVGAPSWDSTAPGRRKNTAPLARNTLSCRRCVLKDRRTSVVMPRPFTWKRSTSPASARPVARFSRRGRCRPLPFQERMG